VVGCADVTLGTCRTYPRFCSHAHTKSAPRGPDPARCLWGRERGRHDGWQRSATAPTTATSDDGPARRRASRIIGCDTARRSRNQGFIFGSARLFRCCCRASLASPRTPRTPRQNLRTNRRFRLVVLQTAGIFEVQSMTGEPVRRITSSSSDGTIVILHGFTMPLPQPAPAAPVGGG
jgi:hypothetical protein